LVASSKKAVTSAFMAGSYCFQMRIGGLWEDCNIRVFEYINAD